MQRPIGGKKLRSDGDNGNARATMHRHLRDAAAGQEAHACGAYRLARMNGNLSLGDLLSFAADVLSVAGRLRKRNGAALPAVAGSIIDNLVLHHRIGASGNRRARHDAHRLARPHFPAIH